MKGKEKDLRNRKKQFAGQDQQAADQSVQEEKDGGRKPENPSHRSGDEKAENPSEKSEHPLSQGDDSIEQKKIQAFEQALVHGKPQ